MNGDGGGRPLEDYGWSEHFARAFAPLAAEGFEPARVFLQHNRAYMLYTASGETPAETTGRLRFHAAGAEDLPAVGDWVALRRTPGEDKAKIHEILPRRSKFSRKAAGRETEEQIVAANVDTVFLVSGLDEDYNLRRLERYLIMAFESGAEPVVVLNKADLVDPLKRLRLRNRFPGALQLSAATGDGVDALRARVAARFSDRFEPVRLLLPHDEGRLLADLYALGAPIEERVDRPDGVLLLARLPRSEVARFAPYLVAEAAASAERR